MTVSRSSLFSLLTGFALVCSVNFSLADSLTVAPAGNATGKVSSNGGTIDCGSTCANTYSPGTVITLTATPAAGAQFTGWLGACTGAGLCQVTIAGATTVSATFASKSLGTPRLDIDGVNSCNALSDGLLVLRYLFGLTGTTLTNGAVGSGAARATPAQVSDYLLDIKPILDIDGNGQVDALTDGLLALRYMFGLRGAPLIANAIGNAASRPTAPDVEARIQKLCSQISPIYTLDVAVAGSGTGTVTSAPASIVCGPACSTTYESATVVALSAAPAPESTFGGWSNSCSGTLSPCSVTMNADKAVSASFVFVGSDPFNCGAKGITCRDDQICTQSACQCRPGLTKTASGSCVDLKSDPTHCGSLTTSCGSSAPRCNAGSCATTCGSLLSCSAANGLVACVNQSSDPYNCGSCGNRCAVGEICVTGNCRTY